VVQRADRYKGIKLVKVDTKDLLGDIFTKGLVKVAFGYLRERLLGW
jgi:ribosomal protein L7Ae-like RNA K-turn-binding protein